MKKGKKTVSMVGKWETSSGKNDVIWAVDGELNKAFDTPNAKYSDKRGYRLFDRQNEAIKFAKEQGLRMGDGTEILCSISNPNGGLFYYVKDGKLYNFFTDKAVPTKRSRPKAKTSITNPKTNKLTSKNPILSPIEIL